MEEGGEIEKWGGDGDVGEVDWGEVIGGGEWEVWYVGWGWFGGVGGGVDGVDGDVVDEGGEVWGGGVERLWCEEGLEDGSWGKGVVEMELVNGGDKGEMGVREGRREIVEGGRGEGEKVGVGEEG